jgi:predicted amidohydrolase
MVKFGHCGHRSHSSISISASKEPSVQVALAQVAPVLGDIDANLKMHYRLVEKAVKLKADLIVFPELSLTGYLLQDLVAEVAQVPKRSAAVRTLRRLSRRIAITFGLVEESPDHRYYNTALFLHAGRVIHQHRKVYLPTYGMFDEGRDYASGETFSAFDTSMGRFGILICEDAWHPSSAYLLALDGADYLLVLSSGPGRGVGSGPELASVSSWMELGRVTAKFQSLFFLYVNRVGVEDGLHFSGGSFACNPFGRVLVKAPVLRERLQMVQLPRNDLRRARTLYPLLRDERADLVHRALSRLGRGKDTDHARLERIGKPRSAGPVSSRGRMG